MPRPSSSAFTIAAALLVVTGLLSGILFSSGAAALAGQSASAFSLVDTLALPGALKWDYLVFDPGSHRLFITHGDHVDVIDTIAKKSVGAITGTDGVHGVALAPALGRGFTSNGKADSVTIFDLATLKILGTVPTEKKPDAIVYDPSTGRVFAANGDSGTLTAIDAEQGKALGSITLEGKPEFAAVDGKGRLFVNIEDKNHIDVIDTKKLAVTARYDISAVCDEPAGLAIDPAQDLLFATCHNRKMAIVDGNTGKILSSPPIGKGSDAALFDAGSGLAFSSNGDGTLTVVGPEAGGGYGVIQTVQTRPGARTMALDPATHIIYLVTGDIDGVEQPTPESQKTGAQRETGARNQLTGAEGLTGAENQQTGARRAHLHFKDNSFTLLTVAEAGKK